jgi:hypothetical protein
VIRFVSAARGDRGIVYVNGQLVRRVLSVLQVGPFGLVRQYRVDAQGRPLCRRDRYTASIRFGRVRIEPLP